MSAASPLPTTSTSLPTPFSLPDFAAAALFLAASSCVARYPFHLVAPGAEEEEDQGTAIVLSTVLPPLADAVELLLKPRQLFILQRFRASRCPTQWAPSDHSLHFFDAHTLNPVLGMQKPCRLPKGLTSQSDSCYLPHAFGRNKPALVVATSMKCDASSTFGWAPTIFVLDEEFNCIRPPPSVKETETPDVACSVCPHPSQPSVVMCASETMDCVMCLNIATAEWYRFGPGRFANSDDSTFTGVDAIVALPSRGLLAVGSYGEDRMAVCDLDDPTTYKKVDCNRFVHSQGDVCSTGFAALGEHYFVCMVSGGIGVYDALKREQIDFFSLGEEDKRSGGCGGLIKALEMPKDQQSTTLGLFLVFHVDVLRIVRCDHQLQWSVVNDRGPLLDALKGDSYEVEFFAVI